MALSVAVRQMPAATKLALPRRISKQVRSHPAILCWLMIGGKGPVMPSRHTAPHE
jgi:hypothetical protein